MCAGEFFYQVALGRQRYYAHQGWMSGRVTSDDNFTLGRTPDLSLVLAKQKKCFGFETSMMNAGGELNWSFLQAGLCDGVCLVIASVADGDSTIPTLFCAKAGMSVSESVSFALIHAQRVEDDTL